MQTTETTRGDKNKRYLDRYYEIPHDKIINMKNKKLLNQLGSKYSGTPSYTLYENKLTPENIQELKQISDAYLPPEISSLVIDYLKTKQIINNSIVLPIIDKSRFFEVNAQKKRKLCGEI